MLADFESIRKILNPDAIRLVVGILTFVALLNLQALLTGHKAPTPLGTE